MAGAGCDIDISCRQAHFVFKNVTISYDSSWFKTLSNVVLNSTIRATFDFNHCFFSKAYSHCPLVGCSDVAVRYPHGTFHMYNTTFVNSTLEIDFNDERYRVFLNITDCHFTAKHASSASEAAILSGGRNGVILMSFLSFSEFGTTLNVDLESIVMRTRQTSSVNGSSLCAVKMKLSRNNSVLFEDCTFYENKQENKGGGICLEMSVDSLQELCACETCSWERGHRVWKYNNHIHFRNNIFWQCCWKRWCNIC